MPLRAGLHHQGRAEAPARGRAQGRRGAHGSGRTGARIAAAAVASAAVKIREKAQLLAGAALEQPPEALRWDNGAWGAGPQARTIADIALYAHGTGPLPAGVEGGLDAQTVYRD